MKTKAHISTAIAFCVFFLAIAYPANNLNRAHWHAELLLFEQLCAAFAAAGIILAFYWFLMSLPIAEEED